MPGRAAGLFVALLALCWAVSAHALTLDDAKSQGLVGEQASGYLAAVPGRGQGQSAAVAALVADINAKRRAAYERIAAKNNINVSDVEQLAGKKAIDNTAAGHYVKTPDGAWQVK